MLFSAGKGDAAILFGPPIALRVRAGEEALPGVGDATPASSVGLLISVKAS